MNEAVSMIRPLPPDFVREKTEHEDLIDRLRLWSGEHDGGGKKGHQQRGSTCRCTPYLGTVSGWDSEDPGFDSQGNLFGDFRT